MALISADAVSVDEHQLEEVRRFIPFKRYNQLKKEISVIYNSQPTCVAARTREHDIAIPDIFRDREMNLEDMTKRSLQFWCVHRLHLWSVMNEDDIRQSIKLRWSMSHKQIDAAFTRVKQQKLFALVSDAANLFKQWREAAIRYELENGKQVRNTLDMSANESPMEHSQNVFGAPLSAFQNHGVSDSGLSQTKLEKTSTPPRHSTSSTPTSSSPSDLHGIVCDTVVKTVKSEPRRFAAY